MSRVIKTTLALDGEQKFRQGLQSIDRELRVLNAQLGTLTSSYAQNNTSVESLAKQHTLLKERVEASKNKVSALEGAVDDSTKAYNKAVEKAKQMADQYGENSEEAQKAARAVEDAEKAMDRYKIQLANAQNQLQRNTQELEDFERQHKKSTAAKTFDNLKTSVKGVTTALTQTVKKTTELTVAIGKISFKAAQTSVQAFAKTTEVAIAASTKAFAAYTAAVSAATVVTGAWATKTGVEFEAQMSTVASISGATAEELERLTEKAKEMGQTTSFSAAESAKALEYMAMAGWDAQQMESGLAGIIHLAAASGEELGLVSDIVTDAMTAFGMAADESDRFADVLAKASSSSNTNVAMMGETFQYVAPLAGAMKYTVEDMAVAIGLMANAGVKGSNAGTALRNIISRLVDPTEDVSVAMQELGISLTDQSGNVKSFEDVVENLRTSFSGLNEMQKAQYATTIAGKYGMSGFLAIVNSTATDYSKLEAAIDSCAGSAEEMANIRLNNLSGDAVLLKSNVEGVALAFYDKLNPLLRSCVQAANYVVTAFSKGGISGALEMVQKQLHGITTIFGGDISSTFHSFVDGFNDVFLSLAQGINQSIPQFTQNVLPMFMGGFWELINGLMDELPTFVPRLAEAGIAMLQGLLDGMNEGLDKLLGMLPGIVEDVISLLLEHAPAFLDGALQLFGGLMTGLSMAAEQLFPHIPEILGSIGKTLMQHAPTLFATAVKLLEMAVQTILQNIGTLATAAITMIAAVVKSLLSPQSLEQLMAAAITVLGTITETILDNLDEMISVATEMIVYLCTELLTPANIGKLLSTAVDILLGIVHGIVDNIDEVLLAVETIINYLVDEILKPANLQEILRIGTQLLVELIVGLCQLAGKFMGFVAQFSTELSRSLMSTDWGAIGISVVDGILSGLLGYDFSVKGFADGLLGKIKGALGIHSPSKVMRDQVGKYMALGISEGFTAEMRKATAVMSDSIPTSFATGFDVQLSTTASGSMQAQQGYGGGNIYITIENASMSSNADIRETAELLADETRRTLYGVGKR